MIYVHSVIIIPSECFIIFCITLNDLVQKNIALEVSVSTGHVIFRWVLIKCFNFRCIFNSSFLLDLFVIWCNDFHFFSFLSFFILGLSGRFQGFPTWTVRSLRQPNTWKWTSIQLGSVYTRYDENLMEYCISVFIYYIGLASPNYHPFPFLVNWKTKEGFIVFIHSSTREMCSKLQA